MITIKSVKLRGWNVVRLGGRGSVLLCVGVGLGLGVLRLGMMSVFFFFSSRRRHTRWTGDWSSDVCSSDLIPRIDRRHLEPRIRRDHDLAPIRRKPCRPPRKTALRNDEVFAETHQVEMVAEIGRASCRERVWIWEGGGWGKKKEDVWLRCYQ